MAEIVRFKRQERVELTQVDGDLEIKDCRELVPKTGSMITVLGALRIDGETLVSASLNCRNLVARCHDTITIEGDLTATTAVDVEHGNLAVNGSASAKRFDIGGGLSVKGNLTCQTIDADGAVRVVGDLKADQLDASGAAHVEGRVEAGRVDVGGAFTCNNGFIKDVDVGGSFKATGTMEIGGLDVGGVAVVGPKSKIVSVDVGGVFKATGDIAFETVDVGGTVKIEGNATGKSIEVGGVLKVEGSLLLTDELDVGGAVSVKDDLEARRRIRVGGKVRAGSKIESPVVAVGGGIEAVHIHATQQFSIGQHGEVRGFVEGGELLIRRKARGDTFYGNSIRVEEGGRVRYLYGQDIYLERDVTVEGDLLYTGTLETEKNVHLAKEPRKVGKLPSPEQFLK
jgi:cytoskeletal protein CcmA (bactofilin family)